MFFNAQPIPQTCINKQKVRPRRQVPIASTQTLSMHRPPPAGVPSVPGQAGLTHHYLQLELRITERTVQNNARMHLIDGNNCKVFGTAETDDLNETDPNAVVLVELLVPLRFLAAGSTAFKTDVLLLRSRHRPWLVMCHGSLPSGSGCRLFRSSWPDFCRLYCMSRLRTTTAHP